MISQTDIRTYLELRPIVGISLWWQLLILVAAIVGILLFVFRMYLRDSRNLPNGLTVLLVSLRVIAFCCILAYVLNPGKRTETRVIKTSRIAILVDTSLSMGLRDREALRPSSVEGPRRIDQVVQWLKQTPEIELLRQEHDLSFYRFGANSQPTSIATLPKTGLTASKIPLREQNAAQLKSDFQRSWILGMLGIVLGLVGFALLATWIATLFSGRLSSQVQANVLCGGVLVVIAALVAMACSDLATPQFDLWTSLGWKDAALANLGDQNLNDQNYADGSVEQITMPSNWEELLAPKATATELGSAIQYIVNKERGGPISGIAVLTDGRNNSGVEPSRATAAAANAGIPIFPIGIGSNTAPQNVLVTDVQAPPRVFPSDKFQVKGIVKSFGLSGKTVRVTLVSIDQKEQEAETIEDETMVRLLDDGQAVLVKFDVQHQEQGKRRYIIRAESIEGDLDQRDNQRAAIVEIVERQTKVLMIAGGPNREFRFLRNQLYRDKDILLHVWLQSSTSGADQEADVLVQEFPGNREGLFSFDCIIAFDPDWRALSESQSELLERWVAEQAGGLIVVAGPVNTPEWTRRPRGDEAIDKLRRLYPVSFYSQGSAQLKLGRFGGDQPFPLDFSREGRAAEFLWLGESASQSQANWGEFEGVFGYYAVNEPKPGADILANFADPSTSIDDKLPIYLASHFYGAGRVFFQASSEMWRIRRIDVEHFQDYYTKLIRWAAQGRLLRDSTRGVLLTDRDRCWMGDQVVVQAILRDAQDQPLMHGSVDATIKRPNETTQILKLKPTENAVRPGTFHGHFTTGSEGDYRISLPIPESVDFEVLTTTVEANIPDLEKEQPQRNDALLTELADRTLGHYYVGTDSFRSTDENPLSPAKLIQPQDQETFLAGTLDRFFQRKLMMWLLGLIATALAFEWSVRRLHKLA